MKHVMVLLMIVLQTMAHGREQDDSVYNSCKNWKEAFSRSKSGVYTMRDENKVPYVVWCDMDTDEGGWTLVASIHENNIDTSGHCTTGDRWSSEQGNTDTRPEGDGNWANLNTFGQLTAAASDDYKNPGYYEITASDIMIWHVPNETKLKNFKSAAYLRYRTTGGFLDDLGGSLYSLYKTHYPIKSGMYTPDEYGPDVNVTFDEGDAAEVLSHQAPNRNNSLEAGYIQFRVVNAEGDAYALCPGIRIMTDILHAEHYCIGSTGDNIDVNYCGDFAAYGFSGVGTGMEWSADETLTETTFMIFYR